MKLKSIQIAATLLALNDTSHAFSLDLLSVDPSSNTPSSDLSTPLAATSISNYVVIRISGYGNLCVPMESIDANKYISFKNTLGSGSAATSDSRHFVLITFVAATSKDLNFATPTRTGSLPPTYGKTAMPS